MFGAATDYALLLVSRFREILRDTQDRYTAIIAAWRATIAPITASAGTVILGLLCLLFSDLNSNQGLGPVAAIGIAGALLSAMTFLPAVLALLGRAAFWPFRPTFGSAKPEHAGLWGRIARLVGARPRVIWIVTTLVLVAGAAFLPQLKASGTAQSDLFLSEVDSDDRPGGVVPALPGRLRLADRGDRRRGGDHGGARRGAGAGRLRSGAGRHRGTAWS